ncbi:MAG: hypothetical protein HUJ26_04510 [Planctomycetaceae bacterium]|nr:hypothetical protein [Planctomycetaceae bacterium]
MSDQHRRNAQRCREKIAQLQKEKSNLVKKSADLQGKINSATQSANRSRNASTIQSKMREIARSSKDLASTEKKVATVEQKIAQEQKKLSRAEESLSKEVQREAKKREQSVATAARQSEQQLQRLNNQVTEHNALHKETIARVDQLSQLPEKIRVVFFAANPLDQNQLRLDEEVRAIQEMIRKSEHRDSVELVSCWAVRPMDVLQAINEHDPGIIHFSGHGSSQDEIIFQNDEGGTKTVSKDAIVQVMRASSSDIKLVFFNTCYSNNQAEAVVEHVDSAIGMNDSIGDKAARVFSSQFYSAIGFGKSIQQAFEQAKALLMMEGIPEEDTPEVFVRDGLDANDIVIVKPHNLDSGSNDGEVV